jgi:hypothetical protein
MYAKDKISQFLDHLGIDKPISKEEFQRAVEGANRDRSRIIYFIRKTLQELYPEVDADDVLRRASIEFGKYKGSKFPVCRNAEEALRAQSSKAGIIAFQQVIKELNPDRSVKEFHHCPHCAAFKELGCSDEEVRHLCNNVLMHGDFGVFSGLPVQLSFPQCIANGDQVCAMTIVAKT